MSKGSILPPTRTSRQIGETLYEYVQRREGELVAKIAATRGDLEALELELAHVKSARRQIGNLPDFGRTPLAEANEGRDHPLDAEPPVEVVVDPDAVSGPHVHSHIAELSDADARSHTHRFILETKNPPTIKDLILKALWNGFRETGATQAQLRQFIRDAYGREVDRTSMSPQIARLRDEKLLKQKGGEDNWRLTLKAISQIRADLRYGPQ
jgi:hypothetical protein